MNEVFKVEKFKEDKTTKKGEKRIIYKALLESEQGVKVNLVSEDPFDFGFEDEVLIKSKKIQTKIGD